MAAGPVPAANFNIFFTIAEATLGNVYIETDESFPDVWKEYATEKPFPTLQHTDGWIGMVPKGREWIGPRVVHEPAAQTYTVISRPWEQTMAIDRFTMDADFYGVFMDTVTHQARQARRAPNYWTRDLIEASGNFVSGGVAPYINPQLGTDGINFFSTSHLQNIYNPTSTTYSNDFTGGGINVAGGAPGGSGNNILVGGQFSPTSFMTLVEYMMQFKGEDGEPLGVLPNKAMFPAALWGESELVINSASYAPPQWATIGAGTGALGTQVGAADNPIMRFGVRPFINRYLNNGQKWYVMDSSRSRKPLGWGVFQPARFEIRVSENDPSVFDNHRYLYGVWAHWTPFFGGFPWLMCRSGP
jgi:phage major head subunit gpT-like protein